MKLQGILFCSGIGVLVVIRILIFVAASHTVGGDSFIFRNFYSLPKEAFVTIGWSLRQASVVLMWLAILLLVGSRFVK